MYRNVSAHTATHTHTVYTSMEKMMAGIPMAMEVRLRMVHTMTVMMASARKLWGEGYDGRGYVVTGGGTPCTYVHEQSRI